MAELRNPEEIMVCINEILTDDELRAILAKLQSNKDRDDFGLVCKRWLLLQSTERKKLCARAGPVMLQKMAARFSRLIELDLSQSTSRSFYPGVIDSDLSVIAASFTCLQILSLQNCKGITDVGMTYLGKGLPSLQSLDVSSCRKLTDKGLVSVANGCHNLRSLHLPGCKFVTDGLLQALSKNCHHLEELGLEGCIKITDNGLVTLVDGCRHIKYLDINKCFKIGDVGISKLSQFCSSSLRTLKMLDCCDVGDESIFSLAKYCKCLKILVMGGCREVSDESVKALAFSFGHSLKYVRMDWCLKISNSSLSCVLSHCKNLEVLDIGCCREVTDTAFLGLGKGGFESGLKLLKVNNCPGITVSGIQLLLQFCKYLEYLDVRACPHITKALCDQARLQFPEFCKVNFLGSLLDSDPADGFLFSWINAARSY
ncbi:RNI-like superfamily protein [Tasmannia lanceolata]|uniref:RNI-like superfamily protein n=1 Tax=Tasmannia lanceolata TaxID=3420 RepID=UPI0040639173